MTTLDRAVSVHPYYRVSEGKLNEFRRLCEQFLSVVRSEPKCLYYGFSFNGHEVFCREAYDGAEGLLEHVANVAPLLTDTLKIAQLTRLEVHGPEEELAKLRTPLSDFNPTYFTVLYVLRQ
jgi:quinol monooxygenase YgiN